MPQRRVTRSKTTMYTPGKPSSPGGTAAMNLIRQRGSCPFMVRDAPVGGTLRCHPYHCSSTQKFFY